MTPPTPDLAEWILTRIGEDEAKVQWMRDELARARQARLFPSLPVDLAASSITGISIFVDPDRWAAECAAKRLIIERHGGWCGGCPPGACHVCREATYDEPCELQFLAAVYQSHPDFREEWRP